MVVVDSNVIVYWLVQGAFTEAARHALARDPEWVGPLLWRSEFRNALIRYVRRGEFSLNHAISLQETAEEFMNGREYAIASKHVLALADESGRSAYDCEFAALAQQLGVRLVTSDKPVIRAFPTIAISIEDFAEGAG